LEKCPFLVFEIRISVKWDHSNSDVSSKDGYDEVSWDPNAALIWGADLESHNTILCRFLLKYSFFIPSLQYRSTNANSLNRQFGWELYFEWLLSFLTIFD
jgi:hypothetical protein